MEPQWRAWVATLQKKVLAEKDVDDKRAAASTASDAAKDAARSWVLSVDALRCFLLSVVGKKIWRNVQFVQYVLFGSRTYEVSHISKEYCITVVV